MSDEPVVVVRGEAFAEADPEIASLHVTVSARDRGRAEVLQRLAARQEWVRDVLDRFASAVEKRETGGMHVYPETRGRSASEKVTGHSGHISTEVTVSDLGALGDLVVALAGQEQVSLTGPWWSLRPESPVYRQVRHDAIRAALARGHEYATVLGSRVTGLEQLSDSGQSEDQVVYRATAASYGTGREVPQLDLEPQRQRVRATVEARFRITPPALGPGEAP